MWHELRESLRDGLPLGIPSVSTFVRFDFTWHADLWIPSQQKGKKIAWSWEVEDFTVPGDSSTQEIFWLLRTLTYETERVWTVKTRNHQDLPLVINSVRFWVHSNRKRRGLVYPSTYLKWTVKIHPPQVIIWGLLTRGNPGTVMFPNIDLIKQMINARTQQLPWVCSVKVLVYIFFLRNVCSSDFLECHVCVFPSFLFFQDLFWCPFADLAGNEFATKLRHSTSPTHIQETSHNSPPLTPWHYTPPYHPTTPYLLIPTLMYYTLTPWRVRKFCSIVFPKLEYSSLRIFHTVWLMCDITECASPTLALYQ